MKKLFIIAFLFLSISFALDAQVVGRIQTITDTLQGNETVDFGPIYASGSYNSIFVEVACTQLGGTSDGTLIFRQGVDSLNTVNSADYPSIEFESNDTLTITDGAEWIVNVTEPTAYQYDIQGAGTASDTTIVRIRYIIK